MVQRDRLTIKEAGKMMGIKESTAKLIVSRFRTSGTIYETSKDREARLKKKEESHRAGEANISPILESHSKPVMP
jgi:transposase